MRIAKEIDDKIPGANIVGQIRKRFIASSAESAVIWRLDRPRGLDGAGEELIRRRTYQPIGRFCFIA